MDSIPDRGQASVDSDFIACDDGGRLEHMPFDDDEEVCDDKNGDSESIENLTKKRNI